jgi:hypothetical protein
MYEITRFDWIPSVIRIRIFPFFFFFFKAIHESSHIGDPAAPTLFRVEGHRARAFGRENCVSGVDGARASDCVDACVCLCLHTSTNGTNERTNERTNGRCAYDFFHPRVE